jgi:hypothetical protein
MILNLFYAQESICPTHSYYEYTLIQKLISEYRIITPFLVSVLFIDNSIALRYHPCTLYTYSLLTEGIL